MSDFAAIIYPTHAEPTSPPAAPAAPAEAPGPDPHERHERLASLLYPSMKPPEPEKPPAAAPPEGAGAAAAPGGSQVAPAGDPGASAPETQPADGAAEPPGVDALPEFISTTHPVAWGEPAADAATIRDALEEVAPMMPEATVPDRNDRRAFAAALGQIGAGESVAREIATDLAGATVKPFAGTREAGTAALTRLWGDRTAANLQAAKGVIDEMERAYPGTKATLNATGLGNSPAFIRKIAAFAHAKARRS